MLPCNIYYTPQIKSSIIELQYNILNAPKLYLIPMDDVEYPLTVKETITIRDREVNFILFDSLMLWKRGGNPSSNLLFFITDGLEANFELYDKFIEGHLFSLDSKKAPKLNLILFGGSNLYESEFKRRALPQFMVSSCTSITSNSFYQSLAPIFIGNHSQNDDIIFDLKTLLPMSNHQHHIPPFPKDMLSQLPLIIRNSTRNWKVIAISYKEYQFIIKAEENIYRVQITKSL